MFKGVIITLFHQHNGSVHGAGGDMSANTAAAAAPTAAAAAAAV